MGLLGGGEDSLSSSSGWGILPPINSSSEWGSSSTGGTGGSSSSSASVISHWQSSTGSSSNSAGNNVATTTSTTSSSSVTVNHNNSTTNANVVNRQLNANSVNDPLSSSPKPSSSWAQAAGKGLVNTNNGPNSGVANSSSHESASNNVASSHVNNSNNNVNNSQLQQQQQQQSTSSSSNIASNANMNGVLNSSAFQGSNNNTSGGLIGLSSTNTIDAAGTNNTNTKQQRTGHHHSGSASAGINDLIGQLGDDFREPLLTEKWGSNVINQESPWNLPPSPQSSPKETSTWRCPINSGTEIWESSVRQKKGSIDGSSATSNANMGTSSSTQQPWNQMSMAHIGGNWGDEDDSANHWTGVPHTPSSSSHNSVGTGSGNGGNSSASSVNMNNVNNSGNVGFGGGVSGGSSGLSALSAVNSSSINSWSTGPGLSNGSSGISSFPLLTQNVIGANTINSIADGCNSSNVIGGGNNWNKNSNGDNKGSYESRSKSNSWGNFDQVESNSENNWDKSTPSGNDATFGTWNIPDSSTKKESSWDKDSNEGSKNVDDGTAVWGSTTRAKAPTVAPTPAPGWKENKMGNNKNGFGGWNGNAGIKSVGAISRNWNESSNRKSPSMWNDDPKAVTSNMPQNIMSEGQIDTSNWFVNKKDEAEAALRNCAMRFHDALTDLSKRKNNVVPTNNINNKNSSTRSQFGGSVPNSQNEATRQMLLNRIQYATNTGMINPQNLEAINEMVNQMKKLKELQGQLGQMNNNMDKQSTEFRIQQTKANINMLQEQLRNETAIVNGVNNMQIGDLFKSANEMYGVEYGDPRENNSMSVGGSRLSSWKQFKQPNINDDKLNAMTGDFIRAPGPLAKQSSSSGAANWCTNFPVTEDAGWPGDLSNHLTKMDNGSTAGSVVGPGQQQPSLIDEYTLPPFPVQDGFESYKSSWNKTTAKGMGVDDDPRSPISQNANIKDSFIWNSVNNANSGAKANSLLGGNGNTQSQMDSLNTFGFGADTNSTWSFSSGNGNSSSQMFGADIGKKNSGGKSTWGNQGLGSDYTDTLWNPSANNSGGGNGKRPPPGLSQMKNSNASNNSNSIWGQSGLQSNSHSNCEYLRLRNLTQQIDGSTLRTLCLQHGPLLQFHLIVNHGTAIVRYANRDQVAKAQSALNNCVLGNTTILADILPDTEVQHYLQLASNGGHSSIPNLSNGTNGSGSSGHHQSHPQSAQSSQQQQQQPNTSHHHASHHSQSYNSNWSNGTNASQSTSGAGSGVAQQSSQNQPQHLQSNSLYSRSGGGNSTAVAAHLFGANAINSFPVQTTSPASSLPYGGGGPGLVTTHSSSLPYNVLNQASVGVSQFNNKMDNPLLSSWNTGSNSLWDTSLLGGSGGNGAGGNLWSTASGFPADRNTPIQNFLPGDLLAGENN